MIVRDRLGVAAVRGVATYCPLLRIAEAKCDAAVGGEVVPLDARHPEERGAFEHLRSRIAAMGDAALSDRLEDLRQKHEIWVAPRLVPERWAVYVEAPSLVKRIAIHRDALLLPVARRYATPRPAG